MRAYHGSTSRFDDFRVSRRSTITQDVADVPIFVTDDRNFARLHARQHGWIYTLDVDLGNVFDGGDLYRESRYWPPAPEDLTPEGEALWNAIDAGEIFEKPDDAYQTDQYLAAVLNHNWDSIEHPGMLAWMKAHGYDSARIRGESTGNHFALWDPKRIRIVDVQPVNDAQKSSSNPRQRELAGRLARGGE